MVSLKGKFIGLPKLGIECSLNFSHFNRHFKIIPNLNEKTHLDRKEEKKLLLSQFDCIIEQPVNQMIADRDLYV